MYCSIFDMCSGQGHDVGVLCHTAPDELCQQVYKESEAIWPAAVSLGRRCGAQQVGPEARCAGTGTDCWLYPLLSLAFFFFEQDLLGRQTLYILYI